ncbi:hypothetical protein MAE02_56550 [Microvirga aerophila]|uniref:Uncharacterized protein n=1 Tax=Microvirga aerophila TaxID=670291 RepID=A0A512C176_9HYPH|nr:hypothetical protein MAE02_56550 [Microvirga aerophila]
MVVGAITSEGGEWAWDLVEQEFNLRAVIDLAGRQSRREDLPGLSVNTNVQLSPGSASPGTMLLDQPLAGSA